MRLRRRVFREWDQECRSTPVLAIFIQFYRQLVVCHPTPEVIHVRLKYRSGHEVGRQRRSHLHLSTESRFWVLQTEHSDDLDLQQEKKEKSENARH
jgi:hypothetical protein